MDATGGPGATQEGDITGVGASKGGGTQQAPQAHVLEGCGRLGAHVGLVACVPASAQGAGAGQVSKGTRGQWGQGGGQDRGEVRLGGGGEEWEVRSLVHRRYTCMNSCRSSHSACKPDCDQLAMSTSMFRTVCC